MSPFIQRAAELAERFGTLAALDGVDILVDRQKDVLSEISRSVAKARGAMVSILWTGGRYVEGARTAFEAEYEVTIYSRPILRGGEAPADEILAATLAAVQEWKADPSINIYQEFKVVGAVSILPNKSFLIYSFTINGRVNLTNN